MLPSFSMECSMKPMYFYFKAMFIAIVLAVIAACGDGKGDEVSKPPVDESAPVVTLNGASSISLLVGDIYEELGATAKDSQGNDLTVAISGSVDTSKVGQTTISYSATDAAGKSANAQRTVIVEEAKPFITTWIREEMA